MAKDAESPQDDNEPVDAAFDAEGSDPAADEGAQSATSADIDAETAEGDRTSAAADEEDGDGDDDDERAADEPAEADADAASSAADGDEAEASDDDAGASEAAEKTRDAAASGSGAAKARPSKPTAPARRASRLWWALPILMVVEFWAYGSDGRIDVCVGKEGDTDFSLVGQERTDANRWKFPRCETRTNLGLRSHHDEQVEDAVRVACRGATLLRYQGETKACVAAEGDWRHHVESHFVPPWDPEYYQHLFWFLQ